MTCAPQPFKADANLNQSFPQHFTIAKLKWLNLFKEIIAVYSENRTTPIKTIRTVAVC
jgi:hypothetical protein